MKETRKYEGKVKPRLFRRKDFIVEHLRKEWEAGEKAVRREDMVRKVKSGGIAAGKGFLILLALVGTLTVAVVAPNVFGAFGRVRGKKIYRTYADKKSLEEDIRYWRRRKYLRCIKKDENEYVVNLTSFGEKRLLQRAFGEFKIQKPEKWDGLWRIIIFDIPDRHKSAREGFRARMKAMGFCPLQKSVFVFPFPCEEELRFLTYIYNVGDYVRYIETGTIKRDMDLRRYFTLDK